MASTLMARPKKTTAQTKTTWKEKLSALTRKRQRRQQTVVNEYERVVRSLQAGETVDDDQVVEILDSAGKSTADLTGDISLLEKRIRWRGVYDRAVAAQDKLSSLEANLAKLQTEKATFEAEWKRRYSPLAAERNQAIAEHAQLATSRNSLWQHSWPSAQAKRTSLEAEMRDASQAVQAKKDFIAEHESNLRHLQNTLEDDLKRRGWNEVGDYTEQKTAIANLEKRLVMWRAELLELQKQLDVANRELVEHVDGEMLRP